MSDSALRTSLIRLAHANPALRVYLLPMLKEAAAEKLGPEYGHYAGKPFYAKDKEAAEKTVAAAMASPGKKILILQGPKPGSMYREHIIAVPDDEAGELSGSKGKLVQWTVGANRRDGVMMLLPPGFTKDQAVKKLMGYEHIVLMSKV